MQAFSSILEIEHNSAHNKLGEFTDRKKRTWQTHYLSYNRNAKLGYKNFKETTVQEQKT